jgi:hypothetical protein
LFREAFEGVERRSGPGHRDTIDYGTQYASLLEKVGKAEEATAVRKRLRP